MHEELDRIYLNKKNHKIPLGVLELVKEHERSWFKRDPTETYLNLLIPTNTIPFRPSIYDKLTNTA